MIDLSEVPALKHRIFEIVPRIDKGNQIVECDCGRNRLRKNTDAGNCIITQTFKRLETSMISGLRLAKNASLRFFCDLSPPCIRRVGGI